MDRLSRSQQTAFVIEVIVCFGPAIVFLGLGVLILSALVYSSAASPIAWEGIAILTGIVTFGGFGVAALISAVRAICANEPRIKRPAAVIAGSVLGCTSLAFFFVGDISPLFGLLPIIASAHIAFLARSLLFSKRALMRAAVYILVVAGIAAAGYFFATSPREPELQRLLFGALK